jgi:uncharacterized damage-inducible protein DinB
MTSADLLVDAFGRIRELVHKVVADLTPEQLAFRVDSDANSIAWLVWHLTRIQDDHIAGVAETSSADVAAVQVESGNLLTRYHDAVHERTIRFVRGLTDAALPRVVDDNWDPPVTLGVRLVSIISDNFQHAGQAAFIRGVIERR